MATPLFPNFGGFRQAGRRQGLQRMGARRCGLVLLGLVASLMLVAGNRHVSPPSLIVLTTPPEGRQTTLWLAAHHSAPTRLGQFAHAPAGDVRAAMFNATTVMATAPFERRRDRSFDTGLYRLPLHGEPQLLLRELTHASRPLVHRGELFVVRGKQGPSAPQPGTMRVDQLGLDRVNAQSGEAVRLHAYEGYWLHLAGAWRDEVLLYRVGPGQADLVAVHRASGKARVFLRDLPPFARDFSVAKAGGQLVFRGRNPKPGPTWQIESVDIATGTRRVLHLSDEPATAPFAWQNGIVYNPQRRGLSLLTDRPHWASPLGPGVDVIEATSQHSDFVAARHTVAGNFATAFILSADGRHWPIATQQGERLAIAGFVEGAQ